MDLGSSAFGGLENNRDATGLNPDGPAFTYYPGKETFFEDALVAEVPRRRFNLKALWGMSIEDLLVYAIAHELGHALCNERDEAKANRTAKLLRQGRPPSCEINLHAKRRPGEDRGSAER